MFILLSVGNKYWANKEEGLTDEGLKLAVVTSAIAFVSVMVASVLLSNSGVKEKPEDNWQDRVAKEPAPSSKIEAVMLEREAEEAKMASQPQSSQR